MPGLGCADTIDVNDLGGLAIITIWDGFRPMALRPQLSLGLPLSDRLDFSMIRGGESIKYP